MAVKVFDVVNIKSKLRGLMTTLYQQDFAGQ
jgi:hypothetical protein